MIRARFTLTALTSLTFDVSCLLNVGPKGKLSVASLTNTLLLSHAAARMLLTGMLNARSGCTLLDELMSVTNIKSMLSVEILVKWFL